jgi:pilus assembly protein CpaE
MRKAAGETIDFADDEEGVASGAASLGPDGGPLVSASVRYVKSGPAADEAWLDDELTDEELAALGEEDFDEELLAAELEADDTEDFSFDPKETAPVIERPAAKKQGAGKGANAPLVATAVAVARPQAVAELGDDPAEYGSSDDDHRPVPRISIHAFCETPETTALLERAAVDRRLSKTHMTMHMGGLPKAVDHFQTASTPNLIIIEALEGGESLFAQLGELAEVCDPSTKVIVLGRANDIGLFRELMRQGISDYIVRPKSPLQIIKSIATLYIDPAAPPIGKTIAFVGARGGAGSSTLAHNVAWCAAEEMQSDTVILDLDVLLDRLLQKHTERLSLFTAPNLLDRDYDIDDQAFETVIDVVRGAAPTIIVDVPHVWTGWSKRLLQSADHIVITATADLASFRNTKNLVDIISGSRPNDSPPILVINQFDAKLSSVQPQQYEEHVGLKPAMVFGWEPQLFHTAATNAAPIVQVGAKSKTAQSIRELTSFILGRTPIASKKSKFSLAGLVKKKK